MWAPSRTCIVVAPSSGRSRSLRSLPLAPLGDSPTARRVLAAKSGKGLAWSGLHCWDGEVAIPDTPDPQGGDRGESVRDLRTRPAGEPPVAACGCPWLNRRERTCDAAAQALEPLEIRHCRVRCGQVGVIAPEVLQPSPVTPLRRNGLHSLATSEAGARARLARLRKRIVCVDQTQSTRHQVVEASSERRSETRSSPNARLLRWRARGR